MCWTNLDDQTLHVALGQSLPSVTPSHQPRGKRSSAVCSVPTQFEVFCAKRATSVPRLRTQPMKNILTCLPLVIACGACAADRGAQPINLESEAYELRALEPGELIESIADGQTKTLNYVSTPLYRAYVATCNAVGDVLEFSLTGTSPLRAFVTDEQSRVAADGEGRALSLRQTCRATGDKHRIVLRERNLQPATATVALSVLRSRADAGVDSGADGGPRLTDAGGDSSVDAGAAASFTIPPALSNRKIDVLMSCKRTWTSGGEQKSDTNSVVMSVLWKIPAPVGYLPIVDVEEYPGEPGVIPGESGSSLDVGMRWPLSSVNTQVRGPNSWQGRISFDGIARTPRIGWISRWNLGFTAGAAPGDVAIEYEVTNVDIGNGSLVRGFECKGTMR
jgi:hypothetical protein